MKRKTVVAVIDSGINMEEQIFLERNIKNYCYKDNGFELTNSTIINTHGAEVIKILLHEDPELEVISLQILQENNKCPFLYVVKAIEFCIELKVNIINMSLGTCIADQRKRDLLEFACEKAIDAGIVIFAADTNVQGKKSYPANFEQVIRVSSDQGDPAYCNITYMGKSICFSENMVYVPEDARCTIRGGTSYLCPLVVGLFCRFISNRQLDSSAVEDFFSYMNNFSEESNIEKIYFNRNNPKEFNYLYGKKILFFADEMDFNNLRIFEFYEKVSDIRTCFSEIYMKSEKEIIECLHNIDIFYVGVLGGTFIRENEEYLKELFQLIGERNVEILSVLPVLNTNSRIKCSSLTGKRVSSVYK